MHFLSGVSHYRYVDSLLSFTVSWRRNSLGPQEDEEEISEKKKQKREKSRGENWPQILYKFSPNLWLTLETYMHKKNT